MATFLMEMVTVKMCDRDMCEYVSMTIFFRVLLVLSREGKKLNFT